MSQVRDRFEADLVLTQLAYTGMLATLRIRQEGWVPAAYVHVCMASRHGCIPRVASGCTRSKGVSIM